MPKYIRNIGKHWTLKERQQLAKLAKGNTPTPVIGLILGRPVNGVRSKAGELDISLKPYNQHPYGTR